MTRLGRKERPRTIPQKQALAAVGQIKLMALYERYFSQVRQSVAQVLLTHEDLANQPALYQRQAYLSGRCLSRAIIPIVNENDTVAVEEMKFGDNDHFSASGGGNPSGSGSAGDSQRRRRSLRSSDPRAYADAELIP